MVLFVKFTDRGSVTISSRLQEAEGRLEVCVKDTGKGIAREDQPKLFQKFQQFRTPTGSVSPKGTGLGLAKL